MKCNGNKSASHKGRRVVIACRIMEPELTRARADKGPVDDDLEIIYLDQFLHRIPGRLLNLVQERIDRVAPDASQIILGYGLCSNGIVGVRARQQELIIPRCHDCIALFLGSPARYNEIFRSRPGTYYLTSGWIAEKNDPLAIIEELVPRYGHRTARWVVEEELKNYTHIALINTGVVEMASLQARAMENAVALNKLYEEISGSLDYFRELLTGPYPESKFLRLQSGETITQEMFL